MKIGKRGTFHDIIYQASWIIKGPILIIVLLLVVGMYNSYIGRDYDIRPFEVAVVQDRVRYCLQEYGMDDLDACFGVPDY